MNEDIEEILRKRVIGYACNFNSQLDLLYPNELFYKNPSSEKDNYMIQLFKAVDKLKEFFDFFPFPSETDIQKIKDSELKKAFALIRKKRKKLENCVLKNSIDYYDNIKPFHPKDIFYEIEKQLLDAISSYKAYKSWEEYANHMLKEIKWIRTF